MPTGHALCFSVSGQRLTLRTKLYAQLKTLLPEHFPGLRFEFLGNPFNRLPFPLLESPEDNEPATTKLFDCWTKLDRFCHRRLRPLLLTNSVIITHGFGLDALLYATACVGCDAENDEAVRLHKGLVRLRLLEQDVEPPEYFITRANVRTLDARMLEAMPELGNMSQAARLRFIRYEETVIEKYFEPANKQKKPHFIEADQSVEDMVQQVVSIIDW